MDEHRGTGNVVESAPNGLARGTLYVVATPIGHMDDVTLRALEVLRHADAVLAEDTRHTRALLSRHGISAELYSLHEHNERSRVAEVKARLEQGHRLALVSDAGTPLISDPGFVLVRALTRGGFPVVPIPGPSAFVAALSVAGLPTDRFVFEGFLPARRSARRRRLEGLCNETRTLVLYESPRRLGDLLDDAAAVLGGGREVTVARELTKIHESLHIGTLGELTDAVTAGDVPERGEIVVCIAGADERAEAALALELEPLLSALLTEMPVKRAVEIACELTGLKRNAVYELALSLKSD